MGRFVQGVIILFGALLFALCIEFAGGIVIDNVYNGLYDGGFFDDVPTEWNSVDETNTVINLFHLAALSIAATGIIAFFLIIFREESSDEQQYHQY
jgi:hypothetical protein